MARVKQYASNAEKQAAYRARREVSSAERVKPLEAVAGLAAEVRSLGGRVGRLELGVLMAVLLALASLGVSLGRGKR